jgi:small multidrug resistance pump
MHWLYLTIAITGEIIGTTALKSSNGFTNMTGSLVAVAGYAVAFYFLALVLKTVPVGVAYAIWSGAGVAIVALIGLVAFGQKLDLAGIIGISLIVAGVIVLNVFSSTTAH